MNDVHRNPRPYEIPARRRYDAIIIGSGSGGLSAAIGLGRFGRQVLLIERKHMGGDCTNVGCIPSKSLLHSSHNLGPEPDAPDLVLKHVRTRRDQLREHELEEFGGAEGVTFVYGSGRLVSANEAEILSHDGSSWSAVGDDIILSTGSSARRIPIDGLPENRYLTNEEVFELTETPQHLAIVGGGPVGLEMAVAFRRLGSDVTVIEAAQDVVPTALPEASAMLNKALTQQGIVIHTSHFATAYEASTESLILRSSVDDSQQPLELNAVDKVLVAVGRIPNTADLGLAEIGVATNEAGAVVTNSRGQTSVKGVWALGDMTTSGGTTHFASIWGRRIIQSIVYPRLPIGGEPLRPTVVFTAPELAAIGTQPPQKPQDVVRITVDGSEIDRSYTDEIGLSTMIVDVRPPTGEILGATVISPRAGEIISTFSLAMKTGISFHRWYGTVIPYPSYGEMITVAVEKYLRAVSDDVGGHTWRWSTGLAARLADRLFRR